MRLRPSILAALPLLALCACQTPPLSPPVPLDQSSVDAFVAHAHDPREMNVTVYRNAPGGPRFDFANRPHPESHAEASFAFSATSPFARLPLLAAKTGRATPFNILLDTSARQSWLLLSAYPAMDYRAFKYPVDPIGEYPDHVPFPVPGYAGTANKVIFGKLHIESPIFYVPMASGSLGTLSRIFPADPDAPTDSDDPVAAKRLAKAVNSIHAVMGAAMLSSFSSVTVNFPSRIVRFSTASKPYTPDKRRLLATLPLRSWRGRPALDVSIDGQPCLAVVDTAALFSVSIPGGDTSPATLRIGPKLALPDVPLSTHAENNLPSSFPVRLGTALFADWILTFDYQRGLLHVESPFPTAPDPAAAEKSGAAASGAPVRYKGVIP